MTGIHARGHLESALLAQLIDSELTPPEAATARLHLSACPDCQARYQDFCKLSGDVDHLLTVSYPGPVLDRSTLQVRLASQNGAAAASRSLLRPFGWGMSLAAALALAVLFLPRWISTHTDTKSSGSGSSHFAASLAPAVAIDIDGESFVRLPYSNPDIPMGSPRIVEMEVPVLSLAEAGIVLEPMSQQAAWPDRSVRADVLLGVDGQPLGVHVITAE